MAGFYSYYRFFNFWPLQAWAPDVAPALFGWGAGIFLTASLQ